jgi:predicted DNA-binding transcriptional regulator YafY
MSRAERLLNLIEEFRRHRYPVAGDDLAQTLGISIRTLYRDIASLRAMGADIAGEPGMGFLLRSGFLLPPIMFTAEEVDALILGSRLSAVMPKDLVDHVEAQSFAVGPGEHLPQETIDMGLVRRAIHLERKLHIHYIDAKGQTSERIIWPFLLGYYDGGRLISAWCETRDAIRHFRTDRIQTVTELQKRYPSRRHELVKLWRETDTFEHK